MDEFELVRRCQAGDLSAFEALFRQHASRVLQTAYLILGDQQMAEDAAELALRLGATDVYTLEQAVVAELGRRAPAMSVAHRIGLVTFCDAEQYGTHPKASGHPGAFPCVHL